MGSLQHVFILVYFTIYLRTEIASTTPVPADKLYQRSISPRAVFSSPTGSNYLDDWSKSKGRATAIRDVQTTISQVQKILETDPTLPRLTRGEIEDLFEEVTKEEYERSLQAGDLSRAKHMRALMLVLPYNANQTSDIDLQELYNRPPITKVIANEKKEEKKQKIVIPSGKVEIINVARHDPTTYKPNFRMKPLKTIPDPTTYRPYPTATTLTTTKKIIPINLPSPSPPTIVKTTTLSPFRNPFDPPKKSYSSHYSSKQSGYDAPFKPLPIPTSRKPIDPELEDILESLGFAAQSQSKKRFKLDEPPPEELSRRMLSSVIHQDYVPEPYSFLPTAPSLTHNDFTKSLGPRMSPHNFGQFKPMPEVTGDIPFDLEKYLRDFGLYSPFDNRNKKALPGSSARIADRIDDGAIEFQDDPKKSTQAAGSLGAPSSTKSTFQPANPDEEDYQKLQELLHTLRELQRLNASLSEDVISKLDPRHFNLSQSLLSQGPNPLLIAEHDLSKNEIKRQTESPAPIKFNLDLNMDDAETTTSTASTPSDRSSGAQDASQFEIDNIFIVTPEPGFAFPFATEATTTEAITTTTAAPSTTTTTEAPRNNLAELGDSFAGGLGNAEDAEPLPPPRKNGFYFLLDVNKFLEVGEDPDKIVVRFDPKVGDPSRFIPVNIP